MERECIVCWKPTTDTFFCPCDLHHPICGPEGAGHPEVPRLDCAYIRNGRSHYTTRTGRS